MSLQYSFWYFILPLFLILSLFPAYLQLHSPDHSRTAWVSLSSPVMTIPIQRENISGDGCYLGGLWWNRLGCGWSCRCVLWTCWSTFILICCIEDIGLHSLLGLCKCNEWTWGAAWLQLSWQSMWQSFYGRQEWWRNRRVAQIQDSEQHAILACPRFTRVDSAGLRTLFL